MRVICSLLFCIFLIYRGHNGIVLGYSAANDQQNKNAESSQSLPNFLILFADDLGYGDLAGTFGHPTSSTPNLQTLGKTSKVFTNFYVTSPVCSPSRYELLFNYKI